MPREPDRPAAAGSIARDRRDPLAEAPPEPPVVARLMIEIRSDGTHTIARGAIEDMNAGEKAAIEARGTTPAALAASLLKSLLAGPLLARVIGKRLIRGR